MGRRKRRPASKPTIPFAWPNTRILLAHDSEEAFDTDALTIVVGRSPVDGVPLAVSARGYERDSRSIISPDDIESLLADRAAADGAVLRSILARARRYQPDRKTSPQCGHAMSVWTMRSILEYLLSVIPSEVEEPLTGEGDRDLRARCRTKCRPSRPNSIARGAADPPSTRHSRIKKCRMSIL